MSSEGRLHPGQQLALQLGEGSELFCAEGRLAVTTSGMDGTPLTRVLCTGQGWRAAQAAWVRLVAQRPSRYILA